MRPDQHHFDEMSRHINILDEKFKTFGDEHGFVVKKNIGRQPNLELHKITNPLLMIGVSLHGYWLTMDYQEDILHDFGISAVYRPEHSKCVAKTLLLADGVPFSVVLTNVDSYLKDGLQILTTWLEQPISLANGWVHDL